MRIPAVEEDAFLRWRGTIRYVPSSERTTYCSSPSSYHFPVHRSTVSAELLESIWCGMISSLTMASYVGSVGLVGLVVVVDVVMVGGG